MRRDLEHIISEIPNSALKGRRSKTPPFEDLKEAYEAGQRIFGENKVQELVDHLLGNRMMYSGHLTRFGCSRLKRAVSSIHSVEHSSLDYLNQRNDTIVTCLIS